MTLANTQELAARIEALRTEIDEIPAMLYGALLTNRNRAKRKDGSVQVSPEHYTFQYYDVDGHRKSKRIPGNAKAAVERLVRAGERYQALEREYRVRLTELALTDGGKKNA